MEDKCVLEINLVKATNIQQFCKEDGCRDLNFHYYQIAGTKWLLRWIEEDTNPEDLMQLIEEGRIYIHDTEVKKER